MKRRLYIDLLLGILFLVISIFVFFHGYRYGESRITAMLIDYLLGSIFFIYSITLFKKVVRKPVSK